MAASWKESVSGTVGVVLVLGILIAVNVIFSRVSAMRLDLTEENLYTLSDGTRSMLRSLDRDVTLKFYYSRSAESMPIPIKQYAQRVDDLLGEYGAESGGRVVVETFDPRPDSDEEEWAQKYGLVSQGLSMLGGEGFYLGIAAISGAQEAAIPFLDPGAEPRLEYLVTRLIYDVTRTERPKIGVMSSLPVMGTPQMPFGAPPQQQPPPKWMFVTELENFYDVVEVTPSAESIDEDLTALIVLHPKTVSDKTLFAIDQFVMKGGRLMALVDPMCMSDTAPGPNQFGPPQSSSDLNRLTRGWGVELKTGEVVGDLKAATQLNVGGGRVDRVISWLSLQGELIDRQEVATSSLEFLMMPFAGAFTTNAVEGLEMARLAGSSSESGLLNTFQAMGASAATVESLNRQDPMPLIVRLQGTFPSAFPEGPPATDGDTPEDDASPEEETSEHLAQGTTNSVVILVSDADMLADQNCVRTMSIFGQRLAEPINDNLNMILNFAEQLCGSDALIGLRSRGRYQRPFTRVQELQQKAQAQWQLEEQKLQSKLQEVQSRISELQRSKQADQKYILSPEQQAEIERFNDERFNTRQQLKEVRKNLRGDIERLGVWVKGINIAAVPLLVAVFGITRGVRRRRSAQR